MSLNSLSKSISTKMQGMKPQGTCPRFSVEINMD
jgi:hypothetical protein